MKNQALISKFKKLVELLYEFEPIRSLSDEIWNFFAPDPSHKRKWIYHHFTKYQETLYWLIHLDKQVEFDLEKSLLRDNTSTSFQENDYDLLAMINSCIDTLKLTKKDWFYHHYCLVKKLPKKYRFGTMQRRLLWNTLENIYRPDLELTAREYDLLFKIFDLQEKKSDQMDISTPTLNTYLEYCRLGYLANIKKYKATIKKEMSGFEMYRAMADGRHDGLLDIIPDSPEAIQEWYHSHSGGGHPWEICRGGNTTHIDLGILHDNNRWNIFLNGQSTSRILEMSRMAIAFYQHGLPFKWLDFEGIRLRMEGRDNIGIIPEYHTIHRANQLFDQNEKVYDCIHFDDLGHNRKKTEQLISFHSFEPLYPRKRK